MAKKRNPRRDAAALIASAAFHVLLLALVVNTTSTPYNLPEPAPPPMEVEIVPRVEIVPPVVIPPKPQPQPVKNQPQPKPQPPKITPPQTVAPTPPRPLPPTPTPPTPPTPTPPKPTPPKATPEAPAPSPPTPARTIEAPTPRLLAAPAPTVAPAKPTPQASPARPSALNVHKPAEKAPAGVPTLPIAPAQGASGAQPPAVAGQSQPGSRLNGLSPYPYGAMPSGGSGLRGSLVGCANAEAVNLSGAERTRCAERFGMDMGHAKPIEAMAPERRREFDKTAAKQEAERRLTMPTGTAPGDSGFGYGLSQPK